MMKSQIVDSNNWYEDLVSDQRTDGGWYSIQD